MTEINGGLHPETRESSPAVQTDQASVEANANAEAITSSAASAAIPAPLNDSIDFKAQGLTIEETVISEELEMMPSPLAQPRIEAGAELLQDLGAIPNKMAFKIGEAAEMVGVKQYVLRYWESEFDMLRPRKSKNNQRVYSRRDVETALMIKKLLYQDRFSIEGARTALRQLKSQVKEEKSIKVMAKSQETAVMKLNGLVNEIRRIREIFG